MAISKARKQALTAHYAEMLKGSQGIVLAAFSGTRVSELEALRRKVRENGGEFHVVKNTLGRLAFKEAGLPLPEDFLEGSTAIGFALKDAQPMAKTMSDFARGADALKIKGGYLGTRPISAAEVIALAEMPPLPVMRARLMGTILAPASQLARILAEPARQVAAVLQAHAESAA